MEAANSTEMLVSTRLHRSSVEDQTVYCLLRPQYGAQTNDVTSASICLPSNGVPTGMFIYAGNQWDEQSGELTLPVASQRG
jgi:hypothetical protein